MGGHPSTDPSSLRELQLQRCSLHNAAGGGGATVAPQKVPNFKEPGATFTLTHDKAPPKGEVDRKREEAAANRLRPGATQQQE